MDSLVSIVTNTPGLSAKRDDDAIDRLNNRYTVMVILALSGVISIQQYVGSPITCWAPVHFTGSHIKYANSYCWVNNTYYVPFENEIPKWHETEKRQVVPYYQWIPFILLTQALLFYMPSVVWHGLNQKGGVDADNILQTAHSVSLVDKVELKDGILKLLSKQMDRFLVTRKDYAPVEASKLQKIYNTLCGCCGRRFGAYLVVLFLLTRVLYIANVISQLFILNSVLGTSYSVYGFEVMTHMIADHDWTKSPDVAFPRVTLCDFHIRRLGNVHRYTLQCNLPINMYTEKIYMFLWFWFVFVAIITIMGFITWLLRVFMRSDRVQFLKNHLRPDDRFVPGDEESEKYVEQFVDDYLRQDGAFLLRLIGSNTNNITVTEIACALYDRFREGLEKKRAKQQALLSIEDPEKEPLNPSAPKEKGDEFV